MTEILKNFKAINVMFREIKDGKPVSKKYL